MYLSVILPTAYNRHGNTINVLKTVIQHIESADTESIITSKLGNTNSFQVTSWLKTINLINFMLITFATRAFVKPILMLINSMLAISEPSMGRSNYTVKF